MNPASQYATESTVFETERFLSFLLANQWNTKILGRFQQLGLTDWWLTAGCIAQSVWNGLYGYAADYGILDYDIFYFDKDVSWTAENLIIANTLALFSDLPITVQIRNQARVPLWYQDKFGVPFPPVRAASDGIDRFPCGTVAVGVRKVDDRYSVHAPFGLANLLSGALVPNTSLQIPKIYAKKIKRWTEVWPELSIIPWPDDNLN